MKQIVGLLKNHFSFLLIGMGSLAMLGANVLFEKILSPTQYGEYSLFVTYISTIYIFGFLGLEQVLMRLSSQNSKMAINLNKPLFFGLLLTGLSFSFFASYAYTSYFDTTYGYLKISIISVSIVFTMLVFNFYWVTSNFSKAQALTNLWKFMLVGLAIVFYFFYLPELKNILDGFFFFSIVQLVALIFLGSKLPIKMNLKSSFKIISEYWFHFFIATALLTLILFFDRYFIKEKFGLVVFGQYFYIASIFLLPFGLLQSYIGFKNLVLFKTNFSWKVFKIECLKIFFLCMASGILLLIIAYTLDSIQILNINFENHTFLIILFLILGTIRVLFGIAAAAVGAQVNVKQFRVINLFSIVIMIGLIGASFYLVKTIEHIVVLMIFLWLSRTILYLFSIKTQFKITEEA